MRILDDNNKEVINPDLTIGELIPEIWASPEAYASIDNTNKFVLDDSDYEEIQRYHIFIEQELLEKKEIQERLEKEQLYKKVLDTLPNKVNDIETLQDEIVLLIAEMEGI